MSSIDRGSVEPLITQELRHKFFITAEYKHQICKRVFQFIGLFYLVYGIFVAYIWTSKELDVSSKNESIVHYFWDPVITTYSLGNFAVFTVIVLNKWWIYKAMETRSVPKQEINIIVCFMLIPLFLSSTAYKVMEIVRDVAIIPCHGYMTFLEPISSLALLLGTAILIFDVRYYSNNFSNWLKKVLKSNLIYFAMIGIINCLIITVAMQHMNIFIFESKNSSYGSRFQANEQCIKSRKTADSINELFIKSDKYLRPTYILFCICTIAYLIQLLLENESDDNNIELDGDVIYSVLREPDTNTLIDGDLLTDCDHLENEDRPEKQVSYRLPSGSLVLCITFLSLSLLSFIIMFSLRQTSGASWHRNLGSLIYCSFISIVYVLGSGLSVVHIMEIMRWPPSSNRRGNIIDKCLIWIGAGGQISQSMTSIAKAVVLLAQSDSDAFKLLLTPLSCLMILSSFLVITQTFLQTVQISLFLDRKWIRPEINSWAESLCPAVGMMGLNMGLLLLSLDHLTSPVIATNTSKMFVDLFVWTLTSVGETISILQRLHASLLFASMIIYTHN